MLVLLDENLLSKKLKEPLIQEGHTVKNVEDVGWRGTKDRELLTKANASSFDVFISADKNLPYEQNISSLSMVILVLDTSSTRPSYLQSIFIQISKHLTALESGVFTICNDSGELYTFGNGP